jgi:hypothetical protein
MSASALKTGGRADREKAVKRVRNPGGGTGPGEASLGHVDLPFLNVL